MAAAADGNGEPLAKRVKEKEQWKQNTSVGTCGGVFSSVTLRNNLKKWGYGSVWAWGKVQDVLKEVSPERAESVIEWVGKLPLGVEFETRASLAVVLMEFEPSELLKVMEKFVLKADKAVQLLAQGHCLLQGSTRERCDQHLDLGPFTLDTTYQGMKIVVLAVWKAFFSRMPDSTHWPAAIAVIQRYFLKLAAGPLSEQDEQDLRAHLSSFYKSSDGHDEYTLDKMLEFVLNGVNVKDDQSVMLDIANHLMLIYV